MEIQFARDVCELQRALHHAQGRVTKAIHNAIAE